jgi:hypothetical protein
MKSMIPVTMIPVNEKLNANPEQPASQPTPDQQESQSLPRAPFPRHLSQRLTMEQLVQHAGHITGVHNNLASQVNKLATMSEVSKERLAGMVGAHTRALGVHDARLAAHRERIPSGVGLWARLRWLATGK